MRATTWTVDPDPYLPVWLASAFDRPERRSVAVRTQGTVVRQRIVLSCVRLADQISVAEGSQVTSE